MAKAAAFATLETMIQILTFPRTRANLRRWRITHLTQAFFLAALLYALATPFAWLRTFADGDARGLDITAAEAAVFGGSPTAFLQAHLYGGGYGLFERLMVYVHASWFFVPSAIAMYVAAAYRQRFTSFAVCYLVTFYASLLVFALVPVQPPWMAQEHVVRILAFQWDTTPRLDGNAIAAMPSLHFAVPAAMALWAWSRIGRAFSAAIGAYAVTIGFAVVFLGEHYVLDVVAGGGLAMGAVVTTSCLEKVRLPQIRLQRANRGLVGESGQNLLEFALLTPLVLVFIGAIVVFGLALHARSNLQQAVREGARQAAVGQSLAQVQSLAAGNAGGTIDSTEVKWCHPAGPTGTHGKVGDPVMVYLVDNADNQPGIKYTLASATGILNVVGIKNLSVRMSPRATARLEKSVPAGSLNIACP